MDELTGNSLIDDLNEFARNIDDVSLGYGGRALVRSESIKQCMLVMLSSLKRKNKPTVYKTNAKKLLNEAGFFHLSELAKKLNINKQTLSYRLQNIDDSACINLEGRMFYKYTQDFKTDK
jgi:sugar diacid utilization regulator